MSDKSWFYWQKSTTGGWSPVVADSAPAKRLGHTPKTQGVVKLTEAEIGLTLAELAVLHPMPAEELVLAGDVPPPPPPPPVAAIQEEEPEPLQFVVIGQRYPQHDHADDLCVVAWPTGFDFSKNDPADLFQPVDQVLRVLFVARVLKRSLK